MTSSELMDLAVLERKKYNYLSEVLDLTKQLGEVIDRGDEVSVQMLLAMRGEPIFHLQEVEQMSKRRAAGLEETDRVRLQELRQGAQPEGRDESLFAEQAAQARRMLERVVGLDKQLSLRLAGKNSFYQKK